MDWNILITWRFFLPSVSRTSKASGVDSLSSFWYECRRTCKKLSKISLSKWNVLSMLTYLSVLRLPCIPPRILAKWRTIPARRGQLADPPVDRRKKLGGLPIWLPEWPQCRSQNNPELDRVIQIPWMLTYPSHRSENNPAVDRATMKHVQKSPADAAPHRHQSNPESDWGTWKPPKRQNCQRLVSVKTVKAMKDFPTYLVNARPRHLQRNQELD